MTAAPILTDISGHVATVTLNRPDVHNAFDDRVVKDLTSAFAHLGADPAVRAVVLRANGKSFSAGADLGWMQRMAGYGYQENLADAQALARLMQTLNDLPKPTVALVQGPAFGGGVGLVACCDVALAADTATFCLSEVKLGLIPAVIAPFVVQAIGARAARRYVLTAERFSALQAKALGLVHEVVPAVMLEPGLLKILDALAEGGPGAQAAAKGLIADILGRAPAEVLVDCAGRIADARASDEGREGIGAFLEKRSPSWRPESA